MKIKNTSTHLLYIAEQNVLPEDVVTVPDDYAELPAITAMVRTKEIEIVEMPVKEAVKEVTAEETADKPKRGRKKKSE